MDGNTKAIAEALRRWYRHDKVVPIERGLSYRLEREARDYSTRIPIFKPKPAPPEGPAAA